MTKFNFGSLVEKKEEPIKKVSEPILKPKPKPKQQRNYKNGKKEYNFTSDNLRTVYFMITRTSSRKRISEIKTELLNIFKEIEE